MAQRVQHFLALYDSENTRQAYRLGLKHFFKSVYELKKLPKAQILEDLAESYFSEDRDHEADVQTFHAYMRNRPPKTVRLFLATVKLFLSENNVEFSQRFWKRISRRIRGSRARTIDRVPSNAELKQIVMHLPIQGTALYLTLASSGMRIGEALQLQLDDINLTVEPAQITIRGDYTKTHNPRVAFLSNEARDVIKQWLPLRDQYLLSAVGKSRYNKAIEDNRIFPFTESTARVMWNNALDKAGLNGRDKDTKRHRLHPHVLRKFFRTKLGAVIPVDVTEALMGHKGYLTQVYRQYTAKKLAEFYQQGEHVLMIFSNGQDIQKLRAEVEEKNKQFQTLVNGLTTENLAMKRHIKELTEKVDHLKADIASVRENWELGDRLIEKLRWLYFAYLQHQYPELKTLEEAELEAWHERMRERDGFYREIVDRDLLRKFAEWLPDK